MIVTCYCYIFIFIWVNLITTEACSPEPWNHGLFMGNYPQMAAKNQVSEIL